jgi:hypothetical protein
VCGIGIAMSEDTYERERCEHKSMGGRRDEARLARILELDTATMPTERRMKLWITVLTKGTNEVCRFIGRALPPVARGLPPKRLAESRGEGVFADLVSREGRIHVLESIVRLQRANEWAGAGSKRILTSIRVLC